MQSHPPSHAARCVTMPRSSGSYLLSELSWVEVRDHLAHDRRLLVPVGACDQYGPHLPVASASLLVEAIAAELSRDFGVLLAPTLPYGVNVPGDRPFPGAASLREKTLHSTLNELLADWEGQGVDEFILLTAQLHDPHVEAIAAVTTKGARVRVIEVLGIDFSELLGHAPGPQHGGEVLTSLMLYLHPGKVNLARIEDFPFPGRPSGPPPYSLARLPKRSVGVVGHPSRATAELGRALFEHIVQRIRAKVFLDSPEHPG